MRSAHLSLPFSHTCFFLGSHFLCSTYFTLFSIFYTDFSATVLYIKKTRKQFKARENIQTSILYLMFLVFDHRSGYDRFTWLQSLRGNKNRECSTWHWSEFRVLCCFSSWAQFHSFVWLYFLGIILSLFSRSPSLHRLFLSSLSFFAFSYCSKTRGMYFSTEKSFNSWLVFLWP